MFKGKELTITIKGVPNTGKTSISSLLAKCLAEAGFTDIRFANEEETQEALNNAYLRLDGIRADPANAPFWDMPITFVEEHVGNKIEFGKSNSKLSQEMLDASKQPKGALYHFRAQGNFLPLDHIRMVTRILSPNIEEVYLSQSVAGNEWAYMTLRDPNGEGEEYLSFGAHATQWHRTNPWEKK